MTRAVEELLEGEHEKLVRRAIDLALQGDPTALKLCLERLAPPRRSRTIRLEGWPVIKDLRGVDEAMSALLFAVSQGEISPAEANEVAGLLAEKRASLALLELSERVRALEARPVAEVVDYADVVAAQG